MIQGQEQQLIGLKDFRENLNDYLLRIAKGERFLVLRRSQPVFNVGPVIEDGLWEQVIDFTKIKKGGVNIKDLLSRL
jgi:antitoxin (DNA-binding transcriptional repressor) of toxin-antitoxin stability system